MISQLNDNPIGKALAWASTGLLGVMVLLGVAWVLPPSGADATEGEGGAALDLDVPQLKPGKPIETYAVITDRPIFNESRQPIIGSTESEDENEEISQVEEVDAPEVELAGVVITPELRVATLRLKGSADSLMALEGQPLEGDFGSWRVSTIEARSATLESAAGEKVKLELQIHDVVIDEPPEPVVKETELDQAPAEERSAGPDDGAPMSRAEEIRQRIAERREELRRAAEEGDEPQQQPQQTDYRQAIQAMMAGRKNQEEDESEQ